MALKLYCYRDGADKLGSGVLGITLYFAEDDKTIRVQDVDLRVKIERRKGVIQAIEKFISRTDPVIDFIVMCIKAGTDKTQCYNDAVKVPLPIGSPFRKGRRTKVSIRKQNQLALFEYLQQVDKEKEKRKFVPNYDFYESVQQHFADEIEVNSGGKLEYITTPISICDLDEPDTIGAPIEDQDFVFEIGDKESGRFRYWGHWKNNNWFTEPKMFAGFDLHGLETLLRFR
jgi:hypothetical protein